MTGIGPWASAQLRALVVVSAVARAPALARASTWATAEPVVEERDLGGAPASLYRAGRDSRRPALVFFNGVTARGRHHPDVERLAGALARVGFLVAVPDLPGLAGGWIDDNTLDSAVAAGRALADLPDVRGGRVGLIGVSLGTTLALATAEDSDLAARVTVVAGVAPITDFINAVRLVTTDRAVAAGGLVSFRPAGFLGLVVARSLVAALPPSPARAGLLAELAPVPDDDPDPLALFRSAGRDLEDPGADALVALLGNRDPGRFDELYAALPTDLQAGIARLSPLERAAALRAPVELVIGSVDKYLPPGESSALAAAATGTRVRLTVTSAVSHADPRLRLREPGGVLRFDGWAVRTIAAARRP